MCSGPRRIAAPPCDGWRDRWRPRRSSATRSASGWGGSGAAGVRGGLGEPRDPARRLTLVDHALRGGLADLAHGRRQLLLRPVFVAGGRRLAELPDAAPQRRHHVCVAGAVLLGLAVLLLCRAGIRHDGSKKEKSFPVKGRRQIAPHCGTVNADAQRKSARDHRLSTVLSETIFRTIGVFTEGAIALRQSAYASVATGVFSFSSARIFSIPKRPGYFPVSPEAAPTGSPQGG